MKEGSRSDSNQRISLKSFISVHQWWGIFCCC